MKAGELALYPITELNRVSASSKTAHHMSRGSGRHDHELSLDAPSRVTKGDPAEWMSTQGVSGFWLVKTSPDKSVCNMKLVNKKIGDYTAPVLTNTHVVHGFDMLRLSEPAAQPSTNAAA